MATFSRRGHPPTPPRLADTGEYIEEAIRALDTSFSSPISVGTLEYLASKPRNDNTPPPSSPTQQNDSTAQPPPRKRLRFSLEARDGNPTLSSPASSLPASSKRLLESRSKSILKTSEPVLFIPASDLPATESSFPQLHTLPSFAAMLEATIQALRGADAMTKRDAYYALSSCLRAYRDYPTIGDTRSHLSFLEDAFERDMSAIASTTAEKKMTEQALQCTFNVMLRFPQHMTARFRVRTVDQCIHVLECGDVSKELLKHQLNLLTLDEMYGKTMTPDRARKILKGLAAVDEHRAGQNILQLRMIICRHIASHVPNIFVDEVHHHILHIFHALLSTQKKLRVCAIETALSVGSAVGHRERFARAVEMLLETKSDQGTLYSDHLVHTLAGMLHVSCDVQHVPQIWGAVMVMMKGNQSLVAKWLGTKDWLKVLERCFNKRDSKLNRFAWTAWRRTIFSAGDLLTEDEVAMKRLSTPVYGHLKRIVPDDRRCSIYVAAYSTLYLLLYHAFGQPQSHQRTSLSWRRLVHEMFRNVLEKNAGEAQHLASILATILGGNGLKIWRADRGLDETPLTLCDLPRLDPIWVRRNIDSVLETVSLFLTVGASLDSPIVSTIWTNLVKSLSQAGEREIMPSAEAKRGSSAMAAFLAAKLSAGAPAELETALDCPQFPNERSALPQPISTSSHQSHETMKPAPKAVLLRVDQATTTSPDALIADEAVHTCPIVSENTDTLDQFQDSDADMAMTEPFRNPIEIGGSANTCAHGLGGLITVGQMQDMDIDKASLECVEFEEAAAEEVEAAAEQVEAIYESEDKEEGIHDDCIILQDAEPNTPPLRDLLRARGVFTYSSTTWSGSLAGRLEKVMVDLQSSTALDASELERLEDLSLELLKELKLHRRNARG